MADKLTYVFELDAKTPGLPELMSRLDRTNAKLMDTSKKSKDVAHDFKGVGGAVDSVKDSMRRLGEVTGGMLLFEGIKRGIEFVKELGAEALNAAAKAERLDLSFELTLGQEGAKDVLEWVEKIANKTEFTDDQLKGWTLQLANAGLKGEALKDSLAATLDIAAKRGPAAMELAVDALSRATLSGTVEGRALRGLGIPVADLAQLKQFAGMTEKQINKALETTAVTKDDLMRLIAGPDNLLGDKGLRAAGTLEAKIKHLKDLPDQFFQKLAKTEAFDRLGKAIDKIMDKLDPDSPTGKKISKFLEEVLGTFVSLIESIDFDDLAKRLVDDFLPVIKSIIGLIRPVAHEIAETVSGLRELKDLIVGEAPKHEALFAVDSKAWSGFRGKMQFAGEEGGDGLGEGAETGTRKRLKIHSPSKVFEELGEMTAAGFERGFSNATAGVGASLTNISPAPVAGPRGATASLVIEQLNVNVVAGEDASQTGRAIADATVESLRGRFIHLLEGASLEGGS